MMVSARLNIQVDVNRYVVRWLLPAADIAVDAGVAQAVGGLRGQHDVVDADAVVLLERAGLIIPEAIEPRVVAYRPNRIGQAEIGESAEALPGRRQKQRIVDPDLRSPGIVRGGDDVVVAGQ